MDMLAGGYVHIDVLKISIMLVLRVMAPSY